MRKIWLSILTMALVGQAYGQQHIQVMNGSENNRNELISIPYDKFVSHFAIDSNFTVKDERGNIILHQLETQGRNYPINLLLQVNLLPKSSVRLLVDNTVSPVIASKTFARYVPERYDDFAWENDILAFRVYGKALEGRVDDAQGLDVWSKRTDQLIIDKWYKMDDYHKDHGEGLDYYSVGQTLGAGEVGLYINDSLQFTKHYRRYLVLDNGPLRTTFQLDFDTETVEGQEIVMKKIYRLDAGSNFNKVILQFDNKEKTSTPIAIGVAKRKEENSKISFSKNGINSLTYWEPEINSNGQMGIGVIVPEKNVRFINDKPEQVLLITQVKNDEDFVYYNGAAWSKAGQVTNQKEWNRAVESYKENLKKPLRIELK